MQIKENAYFLLNNPFCNHFGIGFEVDEEDLEDLESELDEDTVGTLDEDVWGDAVGVKSCFMARYSSFRSFPAEIDLSTSYIHSCEQHYNTFLSLFNPAKQNVGCGW